MAGGNWSAGSNQSIAWSYSGNVGASVSILLQKNAATVYTLTNNAPLEGSGKGTFNWTVPKNAPAGMDYSVVIASNSNPAIKGVSGVFSLTGGTPAPHAPGAFGRTGFAKTDAAKSPAPGFLERKNFSKTDDKMKSANVNTALLATLAVSQPAGGEEWSPGSTHTIAWKQISGDATGNVKIILLKGNATYQTIAASVPLGGGKYDWLIPSDTPSVPTNSPTEQYRIQIVKTTDSNVQGTSDFFSVVKHSKPPSIHTEPGIEILTPHSGEKWALGETPELKWHVKGIATDPKLMVRVVIFLGDSSSSESYNVVKDVPMTGTYPLKLTIPGTYIGSVKIVDPATKKTYKSEFTDLDIVSPYIQILNLAELTAAPWVAGKTYKVLWKVRGTSYGTDLTFAITDAASNYPYLSSTVNTGNAGTYEWTAKSFAKKMKFSITPQSPKVLGASFLFDVDTGKYPTLSPTVTAPSAPVLLSATLIDYKEHVTLHWKDTGGNEKEFVVERKHVGSGGNYAGIGSAPMNADAYQDKVIPVSGHYRYRVKAVNDNGSTASNEVDITTEKTGPAVDLVPVNPQPAKGPAGYCPMAGFTGPIDITIRNLGPGPAGSTNAVLFVSNKQTAGYSEQLKTVVPALNKNESYVWHANAPKCLQGKGSACEFNLMINYNPKEILESDMSTNDISFTCQAAKAKVNLVPAF